MDDVIEQINSARRDVVAAELFDPWSEVVVILGGREFN
ncbi:hypothetical protein BJY18_000381 [Amycolatopsis jiangsuensis]|uniref:Uncharacterized protein n=1 Tax=Amycolatopsis jiangsuensis TaxID=1181879 RepID=A0A840IKR5_9PSEU|nr:hypothetical protein [Amycolatopsis jiangsuensis]